MRKQADFHLVFHYKKVCRTFVGGKANEYRNNGMCILLRVTQEGCMTIIVKSAQLPTVGSCEGGCLKATLERLEPCVGKLTSKVLMGLGFSNEPWLPDHLRNIIDIGMLQT